MRLLFVCATAMLLVGIISVAEASGGYWITTQLRTGPLPGAEDDEEGTRSEQTFTMSFSDRYMRIDMSQWDEYSEQEYGDGPTSQTLIIDYAERRRYIIDHDSQVVLYSEIEDDADQGELMGSPLLAPFGEADPTRSYPEAFEEMMAEANDGDEEYVATELGQRTILGFPAYGVLFEPVPEEETDSPGEDGSAAGGLALGIGAAVEAMLSSDSWYEFWYCEDLGMPVLVRMALFGALIEIEVLEYEPWSPTAEEMRLPEGYELIYDPDE